MIFEKDILSASVLDVMDLNQTNFNSKNTGRNFDALSFRISSDACITSETGVLHAKNNSVCFVPAGVDYRRNAKKDQLIVIHFRIADHVNRGIELYDLPEPEKIKLLFFKILECWNGKEDGYKYRATAVLYEIFAECHRQTAKAASEPDSGIRRSVDYLLEHYREFDLTVADIAKQSFMSEVYFRKLFKKQYGVPPRKYIIQLRIQHAVSMMGAGYYSLKEIAYASGYSDYKYFLVEFKKLKGVSPSKYMYNYSEIEKKLIEENSALR